ncbi:PREDICTED: histone H2B, sperm-like [Galeopterus variegatus]|uniref:Histone H2B, sperm-like n=1 Tax=Galeopterus variegatus TaxID=482537 RepID=A0ABM0RYS1_GALVR|nr:PREDICTED: histone H2B, sperm-like [Galeopterus variegatus]
MDGGQRKGGAQKCSAGSVEGPYTDLKEAGTTIRSPGTGADGSGPQAQRAGTRPGAHVCAGGSRERRSTDFGRPHVPPTSLRLPATYHLSLSSDLFERLAEEAGCLARYNQRCTLTSQDIQAAVHLLLTGELRKQAVAEGTRAVLRFTMST